MISQRERYWWYWALIVAELLALSLLINQGYR